MLTVIIITKNEEAVIADCLESIKSLNAEIIVIDSGSTDRTIEIAEHLGARVYNHEFKNFSETRNFAISKAKTDWVLYLDADEQATPEFIKEVTDVIGSYDPHSSIKAYFVKRKTFYFGKDWDFQDSVQRLFLRKNFIEWYGEVHETPKIKGEFGSLTNPILHFTHRNLSQMLHKTNEWSGVEARLRFEAHHPQMNALRFIRVMLTGFISSYVYQKGYKNGTEGVIEAFYQAFSMFITYAKLWEMQRAKSK